MAGLVCYTIDYGKRKKNRVESCFHSAAVAVAVVDVVFVVVGPL